MPKSFAVVIPSFNNALWCRDNLASVLTQEYPHFRIVYVDDASTDDTATMVAEYVAETRQEGRVTLHRNETRRGATANIDMAVRGCNADEIVVLLDGDDFLAHPRVLQRLDAIYRDPDVWVTWGQFTRVPEGGEGFCAPIPPAIISANAIRDYPFVSSHLRTFYAGLYHRIRPGDLQDGDRQYFSTAGDVAHMFALMEMAGHRARFVPEVLYLYNRANPINDDKVDRSAQLRAEFEIRCKARYGRLASLSDDPPKEFCFAPGVGRSLFENSGTFTDIDERRRPFRQLRSVLNRLGYTVRESQTPADLEDPHHLVVFDVRPEEIARLAGHSRESLSLVLWQDPISAPFNFERRFHEPFGRIFTWHDDLVDGVRYHKLHFPYRRQMTKEVVPFAKRKLCTLIATYRTSDHPDELYSEERKAAEYFADADSDSFDLYGMGWSQVSNRTYRHVVTDKVERLRRYRFSLCYETVKGWNGFVSGKIFDSFAAGCVPVYLGAPDIAAAIPSDCFVSREHFRSDAELHAFLKQMSEAEFEGYLERIRAFLASPRAISFSSENFVRTFVDVVGRRVAYAAKGGATAGRGEATAVSTPMEET